MTSQFFSIIISWWQIENNFNNAITELTQNRLQFHHRSVILPATALIVHQPFNTARARTTLFKDHSGFRHTLSQDRSHLLFTWVNQHTNKNNWTKPKGTISVCDIVPVVHVFLCVSQGPGPNEDTFLLILLRSIVEGWTFALLHVLWCKCGKESVSGKNGEHDNALD